MIILAIDVGGTCLGYAVSDDGVLVDAGLSRTKAPTAEARAAHHRRALHPIASQAAIVLAERGTWRGGRKGSMTPAQLADFNLIAGHVANEWATPKQWKGTMSREVEQRRTWSLLSADEREILENVKPAGLQHNAVSATGLLLWKLGRFTR